MLIVNKLLYESESGNGSRSQLTGSSTFGGVDQVVVVAVVMLSTLGSCTGKRQCLNLSTWLAGLVWSLGRGGPQSVKEADQVAMLARSNSTAALKWLVLNTGDWGGGGKG
jgi:hypothetical protein